MAVSWLKRRSMATRVLHAALLAAVLVTGAYFCPTPYTLRAPGPTYPATSLVHVEGGKTYPDKGTFLMLTAVSEPATILYCIYSLFEPASELIPKAALPRADDGNGQDAWQMWLSQSLAMEVAFDVLVADDPKLQRRLQVGAINPNSPNSSKLKTGDVLLTLAENSVRDIREVTQWLFQSQAEQTVNVTVLREGKEIQVPLKIWAQGNRKVFGVIFRPVMLDGDKAISVRIDSDKVGGASGGLVFCLEILNQLLPDDLTRGRSIAVTGTVDVHGNVGPVEGVHFKCIAAQRAGAQLFLCPQENVADIGDTGALRVVGVKSVLGAMRILRGP